MKEVKRNKATQKLGKGKNPGHTSLLPQMVNMTMVVQGERKQSHSGNYTSAHWLVEHGQWLKAASQSENHRKGKIINVPLSSHFPLPLCGKGSGASLQGGEEG